MQYTSIDKTVICHVRSQDQQTHSNLRVEESIEEDVFLPESIFTDSDILKAIVRACAD